MSILKDIKNAGLDVFLSYHPVIVKLKRESKSLHKELKEKNLSLMQCQEILAKRYGFNNWHHFFQLIKKQYQIGLENIPYVVTPKLENNNNFLIGYDINFGHYKWQDISSMRTHQCIVGENIYKEYDVFLAYQAIEKGNKVFFLNGNNDIDTIELLKSKAISCDRENDLKIIDGLQGHKFYNNFSMNSGALTDLLYNCIDKEDNDNLLHSKIKQFINSLVMALTYKRDKEKTILSLEVIKKYLDLNNFIELYNTELPELTSMIMNDYLISLSGHNEGNYESRIKSHISVVEKLNDSIDKIIKSNIFSNEDDSVPMDCLTSNDKNIYIFNSDDKVKNSFFISLLKLSIANRLGANMYPGKEYLAITSPSWSLYNVFLRQVNVLKGFSLISAQARSLGLSFTYSYSSLSKMKELLEEECSSVFANTNTKIIGAKENDAIEVLKLHDNKQESILNNSDLDIYAKDEQLKNNFVWVMKRGNLSQISFK